VLVENLVKTTLGIKDHRVIRVTQDDSDLHIHLDLIHGRRLVCSKCSTRRRVRDRLKERTWQHVPLWNIPVYLHYRPSRVQCPRCGTVVEKFPWGNGKSRLTFPLILATATWSKQLPMGVVAKMYKICWNSVYSAVKQVVAYGLACRDKSGAILIGIDELSRKKGHVYLTNIYDLLNKRLLASFPGRAEQSLEAFFNEWGKDNLCNIMAVCCDMWAPYVRAIREHLPDVRLVFDKFHIVRHLLMALDEVRKSEQAALRDNFPELLFKTKHLWLKNPWNLKEGQSLHLSDLAKRRLKTFRAYVLKEQFRDLWNSPIRSDAKSFLRNWCWLATHSRLIPMRDFARMLRKHEDGILAYFDVPITNGLVEAMNNNAKVISHRARGYRSSKTFATLMLHCMGGLKMPDSVHRFA
jgi:transposase